MSERLNTGNRERPDPKARPAAGSIPRENFVWEMRQEPISTAPDDGTPILATDGKWTAVVYGSPDTSAFWRWRISHYAVCQEYDWHRRPRYIVVENAGYENERRS
jgi:hypothetical protein